MLISRVLIAHLVNQPVNTCFQLHTIFKFHVFPLMSFSYAKMLYRSVSLWKLFVYLRDFFSLWYKLAIYSSDLSFASVPSQLNLHLSFMSLHLHIPCCFETSYCISFFIAFWVFFTAFINKLHLFFLHFFLSPHSTIKAMHVRTVFSHTIQPAFGRISATYPLFIICLLSPLTRSSRNFYIEEVRIFSLEQRKLNRNMI